MEDWFLKRSSDLQNKYNIIMKEEKEKLNPNCIIFKGAVMLKDIKAVDNKKAPCNKSMPLKDYFDDKDENEEQDSIEVGETKKKKAVKRFYACKAANTPDICMEYK